jgi:predicted phage terminase large subunit-like protein
VDDYSGLSPKQRAELIAKITELQSEVKPRGWEKIARPKQLPPDHPRHHLPDAQGYRCGCKGPSPDWTTWIMMAGRGIGKTKAGANWTIQMALSEPKIFVAVCAPTFSDVKQVCFEGGSGIIREAEPGEIADYNRNNMTITMRNGSIIQGYSAEKPDSIRGSNLSYCWFDELAMIRYMRFFDYGLRPAMRVRPQRNEPRLMITTTPKKMRLIRKLVAQAGDDPKHVHLTRARSEENPFFAKAALAGLRQEYRGTYLERQELEGELIDEADGALFVAEDFDEFRVEPGEYPVFRRIVVAVDPATSSSDSSDETGIVVAAEGENHHFYVLEDCSMRGKPDQTMREVAAAFRRWDCDLVVGEKNGVGDYMRELLGKVDARIPFKAVVGMRGKLIRAQPIAVLAAAGRVHMVGPQERLEDQLCSMTADDDRSRMHDDRADAAIWALRELSGAVSASYLEAYGFYPCDNCGMQVNEQKDQICRRCKAPVTPEERPKIRDRASQWAHAYQKTCDNGHSYPLRLADCPQCVTGPDAYLKQALALSGAASGWVSYTPRDWLAR